jgi:hypothetical protein
LTKAGDSKYLPYGEILFDAMVAFMAIRDRRYGPKREDESFPYGFLPAD